MPLARDRARYLRHESTDAARKLWSRLRNRQLGVKFRREYPVGPYVADFCCIEMGLIVEVDGGQHDQPEKRRYDETRTRWLEGAGFRVIRFRDGEVLKEMEGVIHRIRAELSRKEEL
jgi:adenine-specific DNA-methyltransferase